MKVPAREREPRHFHPNFYWLQEDHLRRRRQGQDWRWTIFRPQAIFGFAVGSPMNVLSALGVYATISRELGWPLVFPGAGAPAVIEFTDARLIARAVEWAGRTDAAADEAFNITNGDVVLWQHVWPELARHFVNRLGVRRAPGPFPITLHPRPTRRLRKVTPSLSLASCRLFWSGLVGLCETVRGKESQQQKDRRTEPAQVHGAILESHAQSLNSSTLNPVSAL